METLTKLFHIQPFRSIYVCCRAGIVLFKLPIWTLLYFAGLRRLRPSWTLKKTLLVSALADLIEMPMTTGDFFARDHTKEVYAKHCRDARFIWVDKIAPELITGEMKRFANACGAESQRIPAYGFGKWGTAPDVPLAKDGEKVILNLHGGGFIAGTAHPEDFTANVPRGFAQYGDLVLTRILSVDYRKSASHPYPVTAPFPTALIDTLVGYTYLTRRLGFKPQNVIICGDSAGGNLALGLVRYLRDTPELGLGMPGGLILISPWVDIIATATRAPGNQVAKNQKTDYIQPSTQYRAGIYAYLAYLGQLTVEETRKNVYLSPASFELDPAVVPGMFLGFPRTYIVGGDAEIFMDSLRLLYQRMVSDMGKEAVVYDEVVDATHDFLAFPLWEPERSSTFKRLINWIQNL
ncbi:alpha/beta hydrolase fold protein [Rhizoctonia solani 123E]|uniref:Alpha/beta hydrolase fold protein n=2 Tax=Rhizoctonia solani TaxID=456999 RepID=A0A074T0W6_9AGAM|nr:alpha/beta hydrolase fold protein [Rhizoctonia solani 123E]